MASDSTIDMRHGAVPDCGVVKKSYIKSEDDSWVYENMHEKLIKAEMDSEDTLIKQELIIEQTVLQRHFLPDPSLHEAEKYKMEPFGLPSVELKSECDEEAKITSSQSETFKNQITYADKEQYPYRELSDRQTPDASATDSKFSAKNRYYMAGSSSFAAQIFNTPRVKYKSTTLTSGEWTMVVNIFKFVIETWPGDKYRSSTEMVKKTSDISGVSMTSIYRILKEFKDTHKVTTPENSRKRPSIIDKLDDIEKSSIRRIVHDFYLKGEVPIVKKILKAVNDEEHLPVLSLSSLRRILKELQFKYVKRQNRSALIDREEIVLWRIKYLNEMRRFREEKRRIFYLDETWIDAGTAEKSCADTNVKSAKRAFKERQSTGTKEKSSKGKRLVVVNIGNEKGFIDGCGKIFECRKTGDYHESMDASQFEEWFRKVLGKLKPNDVIVMDNASCHSRRVDKTPTMAWKKESIQNWLQSKNVHFQDQDAKAQLMAKVKLIKHDFQCYVTDEMAKEKGVTVSRLPPFHSELNPIELVWADIKDYVTRHNKTAKVSDVKKLVTDRLAQVTAENWEKCVDHVKKEEEKLRKLDREMDKTVDRFVTNVMDTDSSECTSESENSTLEIDSE